MYLNPVVILWCALVGSSNPWSLSKTKEIETTHEAGKEDWEIRGRILYATAIVPTTDRKETTSNAPVEDDEDGVEETSVSLYKTDKPISKNNHLSEIHSHKNLNMKSRKRMIQQHGDLKNLTKILHKNKRPKRSPMMIPLYNTVNKQEFDNNKRAPKMEIDQNIRKLTKSNHYGPINRILQAYKNYITKNNENYGMKLCRFKPYDRSYLNSMINNQKYFGKTKREDKSSTNNINSYNKENFWETPKCQIIGDGVDHVCIQYSSPPLFNNTDTKSNNTKFNTFEFQQKYKENERAPLEQIKENSIPLNNVSNQSPFEFAFGDVENNYKSRIIENSDSGRRKLDSGSSKGYFHEQKNENTGDILMNLNGMPIKDSNGIMQHWHDLYSYPYTKENINVEDTSGKIKSTIISKPLLKRKSGMHLPIDITVAMKNLFNEINPLDLIVSNSSYITPDGSFEFTVQLRDKTAHFRTQSR